MGFLSILTCLLPACAGTADRLKMALKESYYNFSDLACLSHPRRRQVAELLPIFLKCWRLLKNVSHKHSGDPVLKWITVWHGLKPDYLNAMMFSKVSLPTFLNAGVKFLWPRSFSSIPQAHLERALPGKVAAPKRPGYGPPCGRRSRWQPLPPFLKKTATPSES